MTSIATKPTFSAQKWNHLGFEIVFNETDAIFQTVVNSRVVTSPSLDALRRKLDAVDAKSFQPFFGIVRVYNFKTERSEYTRVKVVGIVERRPFRAQWKIEIVRKGSRISPSTTCDTVWPDTREAREMFAKLREHDKRADEIQAKLKAERKKILTVEPMNMRPVDKKRIDAIRKLQKLGGAK